MIDRLVAAGDGGDPFVDSIELADGRDPLARLLGPIANNLVQDALAIFQREQPVLPPLLDVEEALAVQLVEPTLDGLVGDVPIGVPDVLGDLL